MHNPSELTEPVDVETRDLGGSSAPLVFAPQEVIAERFKILHLLGRGGMGQVFEAEDLELGDRVAVKVIRPGIARHRDVVERFKREVQLARQVTHPNVCRVFDLYQRQNGAWQTWPMLFLVMELLRGETLARYLRRVGPLPLDEALPLARQMVAALDAAHQAGVVHCDFKTGNVILVREGEEVRRAVVTDFGLAQVSELGNGAAQGAGARLAPHGTPAYMAPEQYAGQEASAQTDLYAFGLVLYEVLTGQLPFTGSPARLARLHQRVKPTPPSSLVDGFEPTVERMILRCLEKDPGDRPRSARAVAAMLSTDAALGWRPAPGLEIPHRPRWRVQRKLGEGGFGEVWLAAHAKNREERVFKFCFDAAKLRFLEREITLFRLLREELGERDDIVRVFDWDFEQAPYFIEMEYQEGGTLLQWAEDQGGLAVVPLAVRLEIVAQVATALSAAHSVGVLHKDVKPANVLMTGTVAGELKAQLTDFGVGAVLERQRLQSAGITALGLTEATGDAASPGGTLLYLAPELLEGKAATLQADVYALGVLLYQVVVGDLTRALAPGWQRDVDDELLREDIAAAVDGSPKRRLGNALRLAERLRSLEPRRARRQAETHLREEAARSRRRRRVGALVIGVSLLFAAAMLYQERLTARQAERAEREASRARNVARVAVAGEWLAKDPTRAALVLLEVEAPEDTAYAVPKMRQALRQELAELDLLGHQDVVWTVEFSPQGDRFVTASGDGTARVWNVDPPYGPIVLRGHTGVLWTASFSPQGDRVVTASGDGTARVWDVGAKNGVGSPADSLSDGPCPSRVLAGHRGGLRRASFSPTGDRVVTASLDRTARVWSLPPPGAPASGPVDEAIVLAGHEDSLMSALFHPDGDRVVTASEDGTVRVWNADGSGLPLVFEGDGSRFWSLALSPTGDRIVAADGSGKVWVWNTDGSGRPLVLEGHRSVVVSAAFDPRGEHLVTASWDGTARVWSLKGPRRGELRVLEGHGNGLWSASFSPSGEQVLTSSRDGTARVWTVQTRLLTVQTRLSTVHSKGPPIVLQNHDGWIVAAAFSPRGDRVVTGAQNGRVRVWNTDGPGDALVLKGHSDSLRTAAFSPDGGRVVTASEDGTARVWTVGRSAGPAALPVVLEGHTGAVMAAAFSPRGDRVATASKDGTVRLWPADGRGASVVLEGHQAAVTKVAFSPRGDRVGTASEDGTARLWSVDGGAPPLVFTGRGSGMMDIAFSPRGERFAAASVDGTAWVWSVDGSAEPIRLEDHGKKIWSVSFSPDGRRVATGSLDSTARVWNVDPEDPGGDPIVLEGHAQAVIRVSFSPDSRRLVTASLDGTARIWSVDGSPRDPVILQGHGDWIVDASFSPDGRRVVTASHDGTARVWSADGKGDPIILEGHRGGVWTASFSPDGRRVVTASMDGTARVWRLLDTPELITALRAETRVCLDPDFRREVLGEPAAEAGRRYEECERSYGRRPAFRE